VPPPIRTGDSLDAIVAADKARGKVEFKPVPATGDLLGLTLNVKGCKAQSGYGRNNSQFFNIDLEGANKLDAALNVTTLLIEAFKGGSWIPATKTYWGRHTKEWEYSFSEATKNFGFAGKAAFEVCVQGQFLCTEKLSIGEWRMHPSFGNPVKLRVTLGDVDGKKVSAEFEYFNSPLDLDTPEKHGKYHGAPIVWFTYADDVPNQKRCFAEAFMKKANEVQNLTICLCSTGSTKYFSTSDFKELVYKGKKEKLEEVVSDFTAKDIPTAGCQASLTFLVDLEIEVVWAVRVHLKTPTSSVTETFLIPKETGEPVADE